MKSKTSTILPALVMLLGAGDGAFAGSTPQAYFDQATPSGAGNVLTIYRVPVVTSTGAILYENVQMQFNVSASGGLTLQSGYPVVTNAPALLSGNFAAAKFTSVGYYYALTGPGASSDGRTSWSFNAATGSTPCLQSAGWTTGPISGHPLQGRLTAAHITYAGYAYGVLGNVTCGGSGGLPFSWSSGNLIGVAATAGGLTIYRYTNNGGTDQNSPVDSASFTQCPASGKC